MRRLHLADKATSRSLLRNRRDYSRDVNRSERRDHVTQPKKAQRANLDSLRSNPPRAIRRSEPGTLRNSDDSPDRQASSPRASIQVLSSEAQCTAKVCEWAREREERAAKPFTQCVRPSSAHGYSTSKVLLTRSDSGNEVPRAPSSKSTTSAKRNR